MTAATPATTSATVTPESGKPCLAPAGSPTLTLTDTSPRPTVTVPVGTTFTVMVPPWHWGQASELHIGTPSVLSELCTVLLPDGGRGSVVVTLTPGQSYVSATVMPASDLFMPAWGGDVKVVP